MHPSVPPRIGGDGGVGDRVRLQRSPIGVGGVADRGLLRLGRVAQPGGEILASRERGSPTGVGIEWSQGDRGGEPERRHLRRALEVQGDRGEAFSDRRRERRDRVPIVLAGIASGRHERPELGVEIDRNADAHVDASTRCGLVLVDQPDRHDEQTLGAGGARAESDPGGPGLHGQQPHLVARSPLREDRHDALLRQDVVAGVERPGVPRRRAVGCADHRDRSGEPQERPSRGPPEAGHRQESREPRQRRGEEDGIDEPSVVVGDHERRPSRRDPLDPARLDRAEPPQGGEPSDRAHHQVTCPHGRILPRSRPRSGQPSRAWLRWRRCLHSVTASSSRVVSSAPSCSRPPGSRRAGVSPATRSRTSTSAGWPRRTHGSRA